MITKKNIFYIHIGYWILILLIDFSRIIRVHFGIGTVLTILLELLLNIVVIYSNIYLIEGIKKVRLKIFYSITLVIICSIFHAYSSIFIREFVSNHSFMGDVKYVYDSKIDFLLNRSFAYLFSFILFLGMYQTTKYVNSIAKYKILEKRSHENAINILKNQVNPHFLMNTLNNIYASVVEKAPQGGQMILQLSSLLRKSYEFIKLPLITIEEEIDYLRNYVELEKIRLSQKITIELNVQVDDLQKKIPPMILLTYVENAFKHGLSELTNEGFLNMDIVLIDTNFHFNIENSKNTTFKKNDYLGSGINNTRKLLDILYKDQYLLVIKDTNKEYKLTLNIQL